MLQIDNAIVSSFVFEKEFVCDLEKCKGACCVHGDAGAPLQQNELKELEACYQVVKSYLPKTGIEAIETHGFYVKDTDGDWVTTLVNNKECAYSYNENGITKCAIEKAYFDKKVSFRKPISCHLYPIRISVYSNFDAVNYQEIEICKDALVKGQETKTKVYQFLKDPLIRNYGKEWYDKLLQAAEYLKSQK